jgi:hypothetical protein
MPGSVRPDETAWKERTLAWVRAWPPYRGPLVVTGLENDRENARRFPIQWEFKDDCWQIPM